MLFQWENQGTIESDVKKVKDITLASCRLKEKDLENIISKRIDELVRTDQLMIILQERQMKEEPDILAIDEEGTLYIFELKRWEGRGENILQVLRYGQKFGRYDYNKLNWFFQSYRHSKLELQQAHKDYFELKIELNKEKFNSDQRFIIITNGLDYDTWNAIAYWKDKGLNITPLIYRMFKLDNELFMDFDPYGPNPDAPREPESGLFVINTNKTYYPEIYKEMVSERKGSAYYDNKYSIQKIKAGNPVCLYHVGAGIIGIGKAQTDYRKKDINGDADEEYYVPIEFEYLVDINQNNWESKAVHACEINAEFKTSYRFRQTVFQLPYDFANFIKKMFKQKGVKKI